MKLGSFMSQSCNYGCAMHIVFLIFGFLDAVAVAVIVAKAPFVVI